MIVEGNIKALDAESIESLRAILERDQKRPVGTDEAQDVGDSIVKFFTILAQPATANEAL